MNTRQNMVNGLLAIAGQAGPNGTLVELDYLESSGVQWLDTRVNCGGDVDFSVDVMRHASSAWGTPLGGRMGTSGSYTYGNGVMCSGTGALQYNYGSAASNGTLPVNERHVLSMTGNVAYYDGVQQGVAATQPGTSFGYAKPIYLFVMNQDSGLVYPFTGRIYAATITKDGVLVRDFVPMLRLEDSKPGMYDRVSKRFFTNIGTGDDFAYTQPGT